MRFLLLSIYSSFFMVIIGSPIDFAPKSLYTDDTIDATGDLDVTEPQKLSQFGPVALQNVDQTIESNLDSQPSLIIQSNGESQSDATDAPTDSDETGLQTIPQPGPGTSIALNDMDQTIEGNPDSQSVSTYVAANKGASTDSIPNSLKAQKPQIDNCKKTKNGQPCLVMGIDWNDPIIHWLTLHPPAAIFTVMMSIVVDVVLEKLGSKKPKTRTARLIDAERKYEKASKKYQQQLKRRIRENIADDSPQAQEENRVMNKATEDYVNDDGTDSPENHDNNEPHANQFQSFFKDQDPAFLQQTAQDHLVESGYVADGALLITGAVTVLKMLEVVGPYAAAVLVL